MTPEEYELFKEAEKAHLRKLKELKRAVRDHERTKKVSGTVTDMAQGVEDALQTHEDLIDQLAMETALNEARLEIALEQSDAAAVEEGSPPAQDLSEELLRAKAKDLVRNLKMQIDAASGVEPPDGAKAGETSEAADASHSEEEGADDDRPDKTIGRMRK